MIPSHRRGEDISNMGLFIPCAGCVQGRELTICSPYRSQREREIRSSKFYTEATGAAATTTANEVPAFLSISSLEQRMLLPCGSH